MSNPLSNNPVLTYFFGEPLGRTIARAEKNEAGFVTLSSAEKQSLQERDGANIFFLTVLPLSSIVVIPFAANLLASITRVPTPDLVIGGMALVVFDFWKRTSFILAASQMNNYNYRPAAAVPALEFPAAVSTREIFKKYPRPTMR